MVLITEVIEKMDLFILQLIPNKMVNRINKKNTGTNRKPLKNHFHNLFVNTTLSNYGFKLVINDYFIKKKYKPKGNFKDAKFLCNLQNKLCLSGWNIDISIPKHQQDRYIRLLIAAKYSIEYQRYDLTIRINKILITYFSKLTK
jgi:hypothetical protein